MPAGVVSVTNSWTLIRSTTKDTLIANGTVPFRMCIGSTSGITYDMAVPIGHGEKIIIPSGVSVYGITKGEDDDANVWWTDFAV